MVINQTVPVNGVSAGVLSEDEIRAQKKIDQKRRQGIVLWRQPFLTLTYFSFEMGILLHDYKER